ncbi:MAG: HAD-IA family hydrolase [Magnetococcales bacterium]|nr:HAD-IA family hydrolase [Magnetococcales bacterium]
MTLPFDLVIFDCDGTLVDSLDAIARSANLALVEVGHSEGLPRERIAEVVGLSLHEAMAVLMPDTPDALRDRAVAAYKHHYARLADGNAFQTPLFPGVRETLTALRARGITLAVATGKSRRGLERTLLEHDLQEFFAAFMTSDQAPSKPHPAMIEKILDATGCLSGRTLMVGDTVFDLEMGHNAGVRTAAVTFGCHGRERLAQARPEFWLERLPDLLPVVGIGQEGR